MEELIAYIEKFGPLTAAEKQLIETLFVLQDIPKGTYFAEHGSLSKQIAFVHQGVFRSVYYDKIGDDFTNYFIYEGRFIGDLYSFQEQSYTNDYVEAITDAQVWSIGFEQFKILEKEIAIWPLMMSKLYAFVAESKLKMAGMMKNLDASSRYQLFLDHYPGLANRVPLSMLASYLGITNSSLSRIRRNT